MDITDVKALIFDVFGTVVDWRSSSIQHGQQFGRVHGVEADWAAFADAWRSRKCSTPFILPASVTPTRLSSIWPGMTCAPGLTRCRGCTG